MPHFGAIKIENFKNIQHAEIFFGDMAGLNFLRGRNEVEPRLGSNGAGKTSIWDALTWCLYGKTVSGLRNPDLIPRVGSKRMRVSVSVGGLLISRTANPNELTIDGSVVGQERVDAALGISFPAWGHTVLLGQDQPLFFDLPPRGKMELLSDAVSLERWERRSDAASKAAQTYERKLLQAEADIAALTRQLEEYQELITDAKRRSAEWKAENDARRQQSEAQRDELGAKIEKLLNKEAKLSLAYDGAATEAKLLPQARAERLQLAEKLRHAKQNKGTCPTCGQKLEGVDPKELAKRVKKAEVELKKAQALEDRLLDFQARAEKARHDWDVVSQALADLKARHRAAIMALEDRLEEINPHREQVKKLSKKLAEADIQLKLREKDVKKAQRLQVHNKLWIKGFKDIRLLVIEELLQELQLATNAILEDVGLIGWEVRYSTEKETKAGTTQAGLNVSILAPGLDQPVRWETWSGGEGQRLRLVGALALAEVLLNYAGATTNLQILDEPTRHLSPEGVRDLCSFLAQRAQDLGQQIWLVDHMAIEGAAFSQVATVVKRPEGSSLIFGLAGPQAQKAAETRP